MSTSLSKTLESPASIIPITTSTEKEQVVSEKIGKPNKTTRQKEIIKMTAQLAEKMCISSAESSQVIFDSSLWALSQTAKEDHPYITLHPFFLVRTLDILDDKELGASFLRFKGKIGENPRISRRLRVKFIEWFNKNGFYETVLDPSDKKTNYAACCALCILACKDSEKVK